jgi:class 3 adenylate cyclase
MVDPPRTEYAKSGEVHIAYQVTGDGPIDLMLVPGWISNVELAWEDPHYSRFLRRLASFSRLVRFDKRGTGLSDRVSDTELPDLEQRMDDVRAVMDAVGCDRAALMGVSEGGPMSVLFAATYPRRTTALVLYSTFATVTRSSDYPWAPTREQRQQWVDSIAQDWGGSVDLEYVAPSLVDDPQFNEWWAAYLRRSASPGAAAALSKMNAEIDVRDVLPSIQVPTLVLHRTGDANVRVEESRFVASRVPGAKLVELPGNDHLPWVGDTRPLLDEVEEFLTGARPLHRGDRVLATLLFTDIVSSTSLASDLGDQAWHTLLERHDALLRAQVTHFAGREIKTTGDGFLISFDGPARAIRCASAMRDAVRTLGIEIRAGLHTGEIGLVQGDAVGIGVHIAARVLDKAGPGEVLVSRTVKDLISGSGISLREKGLYSLKGVPEEWRLFTVEG